MRDSVDGEIFQYFPTYTRAIVVARGIDNHGVHAEVEEMLRGAEARCEALFAQENLTSHPRIASWREAYKVLKMSRARTTLPWRRWPDGRVGALRCPTSILWWL